MKFNKAKRQQFVSHVEKLLLDNGFKIQSYSEFTGSKVLRRDSIVNGLTVTLHSEEDHKEVRTVYMRWDNRNEFTGKYNTKDNLHDAASDVEQAILLFKISLLERLNELKPMERTKGVEKAKETLKKYGYYVDNLWSLPDVQTQYKCTDEQAYAVLDSVMQGEYTVGQIFESIGETADDLGLTKIEEEE
jgi:hypothetical protein